MPSLKKNLDGLKLLGQALARLRGPRVQVGIFGNKNSRDDAVTNSEVGAANEFGVKSKGIPPRSFLRMPLTYKRDNLMKTAAFDAERLLGTGQSGKWLKRVGIAAENIVHSAFRSSGFGSWKPNSAVTIALKGSDKPLIDTRQLERAIASRVTS